MSVLRDDPGAPMALPFPALLSAIPDFGLGVTFAIAWVRPAWAGPDLVPHLLLVMLLEFIVVHSGAFMGVAATSDAPRARRVQAVFGLGLFYTLFAGGFSLGFHTWWPLAAFWGLTLNRMLGVLVGQAPAGGQRALVMSGWAASAILYLTLCFVTLFLPLPHFGLTPDFVRGLHLPGSGVWVEQPHRVIAFGAAYFTLVACSELAGHRWLGRGAPAR